MKKFESEELLKILGNFLLYYIAIGAPLYLLSFMNGRFSYADNGNNINISIFYNLFGQLLNVFLYPFINGLFSGPSLITCYFLLLVGVFFYINENIEKRRFGKKMLISSLIIIFCILLHYIYLISVKINI